MSNDAITQWFNSIRWKFGPNVRNDNIPADEVLSVAELVVQDLHRIADALAKPAESAATEEALMVSQLKALNEIQQIAQDSLASGKYVDAARRINHIAASAIAGVPA